MTTMAVEPPERRDERFGRLTVRDPGFFITELGTSALPGRGLFYSVLLHVLFCVATLYVPWSYWLPPEPHIAAERSVETHAVLLLPNIEPMGSGTPKVQFNRRDLDRQSGHNAPARASGAKAIHGVVHQGPQLIISDPPHPDNFVQTIQQPDIAPIKLPAPLALPPMVSIAAAKLPDLVSPAPDVVLAPRPVEVKAPQPITLPEQQPKVEAPKLSLPAAASVDALRKVVSAATPAPAPTLARQAPVATSGSEARNILVVNAISPPDMKSSAIPAGELHGAFIVAPGGSTSIGAAGGAAGGGTAPVGEPGIGNGSGSGPGPYGKGESRAGGGSGDGKAGRAGVGPGTGTGNGSAGVGNAAGSGSGAGGHGSGSGNSGYAKNPFPSITIQGGSGGGARGSARSPASPKPQGSYGMTIVASGSSGGGFKDYGVFRDETSYTVYLDMADAGVRGPSWALQYALDLRGVPNSTTRGLLAPPFAMLKSIPSFPSEAVRRGHGGTIVVFGVITREGRFEELRIIQSPAPDIDRLLLDSLKKWTFQAAEIDGAKVPVKVLLGVPVDSVPRE